MQGVARTPAATPGWLQWGWPVGHAQGASGWRQVEMPFLYSRVIVGIRSSAWQDTHTLSPSATADVGLRLRSAGASSHCCPEKFAQEGPDCPWAWGVQGQRGVAVCPTAGSVQYPGPSAKPGPSVQLKAGPPWGQGLVPKLPFSLECLMAPGVSSLRVFRWWAGQACHPQSREGETRRDPV